MGAVFGCLVQKLRVKSCKRKIGGALKTLLSGKINCVQSGNSLHEEYLSHLSCIDVKPTYIKVRRGKKIRAEEMDTLHSIVGTRWTDKEQRCKKDM